MASIYAIKNEPSVEKLILLAPALNLIGMTDYQNSTIDTPVIIYHGTNDDVIPLESIEPIAEKCFKNLTFNKVEDDHMLHKTFKAIDWDFLLQ